MQRCAIFIRYGLLAAVVLATGGCGSSLPRARPDAAAQFGAGLKPAQQPVEEMASAADLALLEDADDAVYRFGSGDVLRIDVYGRPEVSGKQVIGPDGVVTLPLVGNVRLHGLTRDEAQALLQKRLEEYFSQPHVTLVVEEYVSNQVVVLGRVERAGPQRFSHPPTLAEVLSAAGAMPLMEKQARLTRCAILRGRQKLIWVNLKALLSGDFAYNIRMKKGDIVYVPDSSETAVYVMGSVPKPGSYRLTPRMTILDALAQAGGPNQDAAPETIGLYRAGANRVEVIDLGSLMAPDRRANLALEDGDVVFVPTSGMADFGYLMRQISPFVGVLTFGATLNNAVNR